MKYFAAILCFAIVFCAYLFIDSMRVNAKRRKSLQSRLSNNLDTQSDHEPSSGMNGEMSPRAASIASFMRGLGIKVEEQIQGVEIRFSRAGITSPDAPIYYLFFKRIASFGIAFVGLMVLINAHGDLQSQAIGVGIMGLAVLGPNMYLNNKIAHRTKLLQRAFPDTLDLLLICVESGLALDASLNRVCNELARAYPEMTAELNRTRLELSLLNDRVKALMNLGDRTGMVAFRSLCVALIQSERFGTSLVDTLRVLSEDFRLQRLAGAEAKAARLPVLMTLPLIFLLMPAFFMIVMGPVIVKFMHGT